MASAYSLMYKPVRLSRYSFFEVCGVEDHHYVLLGGGCRGMDSLSNVCRGSNPIHTRMQRDFGSLWCFYGLFRWRCCEKYYVWRLVIRRVSLVACAYSILYNVVRLPCYSFEVCGVDDFPLLFLVVAAVAWTL